MDRAPLLISSTQNERVKQVIGLKDRRSRDQTGLFLIEGYREVSRAIQSGWEIESLFYCPELFLGSNDRSLIEEVAKKQGRLFHCSEKVFHKLSYRDRPDGLIAIAPQRHLKLKELQLPPNPLIIVAQSIEKPGNLGTILRTADAVGASAVIVCDQCTDVFNPNTVRASVGTLFSVPVAMVSTEECLPFLKQKKMTIVAATPQASLSFTESNLTGPLAIAVGTEQLGLTAAWKDAATMQVSIPMKGMADSLNVALATALLLYEAMRQRGLKK